MYLRVFFILLPLALWACGPPAELTIYPLDYSTIVALRWSPSQCSTYHVWTSPASNGIYSLLAQVVADTIYTVHASAGRRFFYVTATDDDGLESPPSNTVGYVGFIALANAYTSFGLPFVFWDLRFSETPAYGVTSTCPSDILGVQAHCGNFIEADKVIRQAGDQACRVYGAGCAWDFPLETNASMLPGHAYWYQNRTAIDRLILLTGEVDNRGSYDTLLVAGGERAFTALSWRDSRVLSVHELNLRTSGFACSSPGTMANRLLAQGAGGYCWLRCDNTWQGTLATVEPGKAYWIHNTSSSDRPWIYTYDASGNP